VARGAGMRSKPRWSVGCGSIARPLLFSPGRAEGATVPNVCVMHLVWAAPLLGDPVVADGAEVRRRHGDGGSRSR
jgi:hypothetical protein